MHTFSLVYTFLLADIHHSKAKNLAERKLFGFENNNFIGDFTELFLSVRFRTLLGIVTLMEFFNFSMLIYTS